MNNSGTAAIQRRMPDNRTSAMICTITYPGTLRPCSRKTMNTRMSSGLSIFLPLHARGIGFRHLAFLARRHLMQRMQGVRLVEKEKRIVAARQHRRHVIAELLVFGMIDHADRAMAAWLQHLGRRFRAGED